MKIWLDDARTPPEQLEYDLMGSPTNPSTGWCWCKTAHEAWVYMATGLVDEISFDHDLGDGKNGYDVACWFEFHAYCRTLPRVKWHVHSGNPAGRLNIIAAMTQAEKFWDRKICREAKPYIAPTTL